MYLNHVSSSQGFPMSEKTVKTGEIAEITCSFCSGTGVDPFGIMSWTSTCCVCGGKGTNAIRTPYTRCAHCQGTGAVKTFTCTSCMGKGFAPLPPSPMKVCPECHGTGDDSSAPSMACLRCRGRGLVHLDMPESLPCSTPIGGDSPENISGPRTDEQPVFT